MEERSLLFQIGPVWFDGTLILMTLLTCIIVFLLVFICTRNLQIKPKGKQNFIEFIIDFVELLNPAIMIERFTAEVPPRFLIKGGFGMLRTDQILQKIEKRMEERNTWQGRLYK